MAYYDIQPAIGRGKKQQGLVVGYNLVLVLAFGAKFIKFQHTDYNKVTDEYRLMRKQYPHIKGNPNNKHCCVCGIPLLIHCLCKAHQSYHFRKKDDQLLAYKPI